MPQPTLEVNAVSASNGRITELGALAPDGTHWRLTAKQTRAALRAGFRLVAVPPTGVAAEVCIHNCTYDFDGEPALGTVADGAAKRVLHELQRLPTLH